MSNAFALLQIEGEDPVENVPAPKAAPAAASSTPAAAKPQRTQQQAPRNNNNATRGTRAPRNNGGDRTPAGTDAVESDLTRDVRGERTAGQRGGRGSGNRGRGARGARPVGGNRPMDRHSMTDRTDSHKQEHQAWGGDEGKRELNDENDGEKDAQAAVSGVATPVGDAPSTPAVQPEVEAEPEDNTKTYQEWLAEQKKENIGGDLPEARKANEGADDSQWKDAVAIKKEEDDEVLFAQTKEGKARKQKEKKEKSFIEIELNYPRPGSENTRGRGGRGRGEGRGRGGDRGGRGRGGNSQRGTPRSNGPRAAAAPAVDDASAFPSLS